MFIDLLSVCPIGSFREPLVSNLKYVSLNSQPCKARTTMVILKSDKTLLYPFTVSVNKYSDGPYARFSVPSKVNKMNVKLLNFISGANETRNP